MMTRDDGKGRAARTAAGDPPEGDPPEGDSPEGDSPEGDSPEGDSPEEVAPDPPADTARVSAGLDPAAEVERKRDQYLDLLLRKTAEFDNYRRRVERERRDLLESAAADVLTDLLTVVDDFERALNVPTAPAGGEGGEAYRRGVELIYKQLIDLLRKRGVTPVDSVGEKFDPHRHQAVDYAVTGDQPDGEIIEEYRRGYQLGDRLLRPAMVKVAKSE